MKTPHTDIHTYLLESDIEIWIEPDAYCPRLIVKRPNNLKNNYTVLSQTLQPFEVILDKRESIFLEDTIYNLVANPNIETQLKLKTAKQLKDLAEKMERMVQEKIEETLHDHEDT